MSEVKKGIDSIIKAVTDGLRAKRDFRGRWCEHFSEECVERMVAYAETGKLCGHSCGYCDKFKWIIDRAKNYGEKLNVSWQEVLRGWEEQRDYWYMNFYQDSNQPVLNDRVRVFESVEDFKSSVGTEGFRCPCCGGVSHNPFECDSGLPMEKSGKVCDWKAYGLFRTAGKGACIYIKETNQNAEIFMPIAWEKEK